MLNTETRRPTPATMAALLSASKAKSAGASNSTPSERHRPYTTESEGYQVQRSLPTPRVEQTPTVDEPEGIDDFSSWDETDRVDSWLPGAEEIGLSWTSHLRRFTVIDPIDPVEALDEADGFLGFHIV